jgi:hypothetical protein
MSKIRFASFLLLGTLVLSLGCESPASTNVTDGASPDAVAEYEAMIKAEEEKSKEAMKDTGK